jgi:hypothetical protein
MSGEFSPEGLDRVISAALLERGIVHERERPGVYLVRLEGEHKLVTQTLLVVGEHSLLIEAFFVRRPDENHAEFYQWLLERNARMYGVHFCVDHLGDVYLVGRLPLHAVTADELDRVLGCVLTYADEAFNPALELGFATSIRREWAWRISRGESTANLSRFAHLAPPPEA